MKKTLEENVVSITVWTALTVLVSVAISVWNIADLKSDFLKENYSLNTRITVIEKDNERRKQYLYNLKSDLKEDIEKNNKKLNDIYNLLLKR